MGLKVAMNQVLISEERMKAAAEAALKPPVEFGQDPLQAAWERTRRSLIEEERDPVCRAELLMLLGRSDPGKARYQESADPVSAALTALTGALAGWGLLGWLLGALGFGAEAATFLGTALGSAGASWGCIRYGMKLRKWMLALSGALAAGKVLRHPLSPKGWLMLGATGLLAACCRKRQVFDRNDARQRILMALRWDLSLGGGDRPALTVTSELAALLPQLQNLHAAGIAELPAAAEELLLTAANLGYTVLGSEPAFVRPPVRKRLRWTQEVRNRYQGFGYYDEGDEVLEERPPLERDGVLIEKGLVRRAPR